MSADATIEDRNMIQKFVKLNPQHDRIVHGGLGDIQPPDGQIRIDRDPFCLDGLQRVLDQNMRGLMDSEQRWLLAEAFRLFRSVRALDALAANLGREVSAKDADYTGVCLEYQDLSDENRKLKQEVEINRLVLAASDKTIERLTAELEAASAPAS